MKLLFICLMAFALSSCKKTMHLSIPFEPDAHVLRLANHTTLELKGSEKGTMATAYFPESNETAKYLIVLERYKDGKRNIEQWWVNLPPHVSKVSKRWDVPVTSTVRMSCVKIEDYPPRE